jgi:hypothetical protein
MVILLLQVEAVDYLSAHTCEIDFIFQLDIFDVTLDSVDCCTSLLLMIILKFEEFL